MTVDRFVPKYEEESWDIPIEQFKWRIMRTYEKNGEVRATYAAYPDARTVSIHLDRLFTPAGWTDEYDVSPSGKSVVCTLSVKMGEDWISKTDVGNVTDIEPMKGGFSDAFKRAAAKAGVGRNAYEIPEIHGPVVSRSDKHYKPFEKDGRPFDEWLVERAYDLIAKEQSSGTTKTAAVEEDAEAAAVPVEADPEAEEQQKVWGQFMETMKALDEDGQTRVKEWWLENGDGTSKPSKDTELAVLNKVAAFANSVHLEGELGAEEVTEEASETEPF